MKVLLIEDEAIAAQLFTEQLQRLEPTAEIQAVLQTIEEAVDWFEHHDAPDLCFMDIHLGDGSSFIIFDRVQVTCPIVFTTSYNEYALQAFEVNCVDYLLKPIDTSKLQRALTKFKQRQTTPNEQAQLIQKLMESFRDTAPAVQPTYPRTLLVTQHDRLVPLDVTQIAFVQSEMKMAKVHLFPQGNTKTTPLRSYILDMSLEQLQNQLNPKDFFRANRQYIVNHAAIKDISFWFAGRLKLNLIVPTPEDIILSRTTIPTFKQWYTK